MITGFNHTSFTVRTWTNRCGSGLRCWASRRRRSRRAQGDWQETVTGVAGASLMVAHLYGHGHHIEFIQYLRGAIDGAAAATGSGRRGACLPGSRRYRADLERTVGGRRDEPREDCQREVRSGGQLPGRLYPGPEWHHHRVARTPEELTLWRVGHGSSGDWLLFDAMCARAKTDFLLLGERVTAIQTHRRPDLAHWCSDMNLLRDPSLGQRDLSAVRECV